jgi:hypothetical protein
MGLSKDLSLYISNYKCFGNEEVGYDQIFPLNLIIGRNNTGKSTLLDLIEYVTSPKELKSLGHKGQIPQVTFRSILSETELQRVFSKNHSGGPIPGNHWQFGRRWIDKLFEWEIKPDKFEFVSIKPFWGDEFQAYGDQLATVKGNPFKPFTFKRLLADRDIIPELEVDNLIVSSNGQGITNAIRSYLTRASLTSELIEKTLLNELNSIFEPDGHITRIIVKQIGGIGSSWELYFEEEEKGLVPLSQTGSGLKTILLVLSFIHIIPHIDGKALSQYLFGFEELENNLHPALLRRLLLYLRRIAIEKGSIFFLTTHSSVAIDLFSSDDEAQILHVTHNRTCASVRKVSTYVDNKGILDDLDIRASDVLQANGIVWVEGPSDRLYFNRWIELWSDGNIKEGAHYQCVFYGGRLLAHLSATNPEADSNEAVKILKVNRNAIILADSDKRNNKQQINPTKRRIISEIEAIGGLAWVTAGKEIENYIPLQALSNLFSDNNLPPLNRYQDFENYLDKAKRGAGKAYRRNKVLFAENVCPHLTKDMLINRLDLGNKISEAYKHILRWNGLDGNIQRASQ